MSATTAGPPTAAVPPAPKPCPVTAADPCAAAAGPATALLILVYQ